MGVASLRLALLSHYKCGVFCSLRRSGRDRDSTAKETSTPFRVTALEHVPVLQGRLSVGEMRLELFLGAVFHPDDLLTFPFRYLDLLQSRRQRTMLFFFSAFCNIRGRFDHSRRLR